MADPEVRKVISPGALAGPALCTEFAGPTVLNPIRARTLRLIVISKKNAIPAIHPQVEKPRDPMRGLPEPLCDRSTTPSDPA